MNEKTITDKLYSAMLTVGAVQETREVQEPEEVRSRASTPKVSTRRVTEVLMVALLMGNMV